MTFPSLTASGKLWKSPTMQDVPADFLNMSPFLLSLNSSRLQFTSPGPYLPPHPQEKRKKVRPRLPEPHTLQQQCSLWPARQLNARSYTVLTWYRSFEQVQVSEQVSMSYLPFSSSSISNSIKNRWYISFLTVLFLPYFCAFISFFYSQTGSDSQ